MFKPPLVVNLAPQTTLTISITNTRPIANTALPSSTLLRRLALLVLVLELSVALVLVLAKLVQAFLKPDMQPLLGPVVTSAWREPRPPMRSSTPHSRAVRPARVTAARARCSESGVLQV